VLAELLEEEVVEVVGPKGKHDRERAAVRHGHEAGEVTFGGRRVRYRRTQEPVGAEVEQAGAVDVALVGVTHVCRADAGVVVGAHEPRSRRRALRGDDDRRARAASPQERGRARDQHRGRQDPLGLWEGSTEYATLATALLADLVERGLDPEQGILFVIRRRHGAAQGDPQRLRRGADAEMRSAQGAQRHRPLTERERPAVKRRLRRAWALDDHARATRPAASARLGARPQLPRCGRLAA
jgi:hypothetical protein